MSEERKSKHDHERSDWNVRFIVWAVMVLMVSGVVMHVAVWWIFVRVRHEALKPEATPAPIGVNIVPPEPRLQVDPAEDWLKFRDAQKEILNSYGWIDDSHRSVHIPIRRAMEMLAEKQEAK